MRIMPYRTLDNVIEGAVLTFVDIAAQKRAEAQLRSLSGQLEQRVQEGGHELDRVNVQLKDQTRQRQEGESRRATDIAALIRLHDLAMQTGDPEALHKLLQACLDAAMELTRADMGALQLYDEASQTLRLAAHHGFPQACVDHFGTVSAQSASSCAEAMRRGERVLVEDIEHSPIFEGSPGLRLLVEAGARAVQSTPVLARDGRLLGMFSTLWASPRALDPGALPLLDLLARQCGDLMERK
jgi:TPR repeat protein